MVTETKLIFETEISLLYSGGNTYPFLGRHVLWMWVAKSVQLLYPYPLRLRFNAVFPLTLCAIQICLLAYLLTFWLFPQIEQ